MGTYLLAGTVLAFATGAAIADASGVPGMEFLEYGALGLCSLMVIMNFVERQKMGKRLDVQGEELIELHKTTLGTMSKLTDALHDRPCLVHDTRVKKDG
jgi:hypothetical protein